ncbi:tail fiber domain-containing protein [Hyphomicrobium sp.]|uniref:tail fiber domain-containing protein n=1 Tax=Hyphomicrobium sp. TaxID=82 RepID=UPI0025B8458D|nr:tail fiber domain-containing protein [Hyphomicrobium sp.]MCC7250452.1 tail fiber domain-containing protein [Hyphomicrobium sp.]
MNWEYVHSVWALVRCPRKLKLGAQTLCTALLLLAATTSPARANCPAAPIADPDDMAISFLAANGVQAASASLLTSTIKEGTVVYDDANDVLKLCDGNNWIEVGSGSGTDTLASLSCAAGEIAKFNGTAWACADEGGGSYSSKGFSVASSTTSIPSGTATKVTFSGSPTNDFGSGWTGNTFTVPAGEDGWYAITGSIYLPAASAHAVAYLRVNGSNVAISRDNYAGGVIQYLSVAAVAKLDTGDTVELFGYQSSGGAVSLTGANFSLAKLGGGSDTLANLSCATNEIPKWNGTAWACATDGGGSGGSSGLEYFAGNTLLVGGITYHNITPTNDYAVSVPAGTKAVKLSVYYYHGHNGTNTHGYLSFLAYQKGQTGADKKVAYWSQHFNDYANTDIAHLDIPWDDSLDDEVTIEVTGSYNTNAANTYSIYLAGYVVGGGSGNDTLAGLSCASGEIPKWNGSAWACAADGGGSGAEGFIDGMTTDAQPSGNLTSACPAYVDVPSASKSITIPEDGNALINFSQVFYMSAGGGGVNYRFCADSTCTSGLSYFSNEASSHKTAAGTWVLPLTAGAYSGKLQYCKTAGTTVHTNASGSVSWSISMPGGGSGGGGSAATTMVSGWPDAIICTNGSATEILFNNWTDGTLRTYASPYDGSGARRYIRFNVSGQTYNAHQDLAAWDCVMGTKSIAQLYSEGRAFNFIGDGSSQWTDVSGGINYAGGKVGIGTTTPEASLVTVDTAVGTPRGIVASQYNTGVQGALFIGKKARGAPGSEAGVEANDYLVALQGMGHNGSAFSNPQSVVTSRASELWTTTSNATMLGLWTTPSTSIVAQERLRIDSTGSVSIGSSADANASSLLELTSTTRGFLPPRMSTTDRDNIASPAEGLVVYNTTTKSLDLRVASSWLSFGGSMTGSTMISGWPDALVCTSAGDTDIMIITEKNADYVTYEIAGDDNVAAFDVASGAWDSDNDSNMAGYDCLNQTIAQLYAAGKAFNFVGGSSAAADGSAGQIQFNEGGNLKADAALHWDNTNKRLGIGTATPQRPLHVQVNAAGSPTMIALENLDTSGSTAVISHRIATTGVGASTFVEATGIQMKTVEHDHATRASQLSFWTAANGVYNNRMIIDGSGNVGIGTTSPGQKLHVSGTGGDTYVRVDTASSAHAAGIHLTAGAISNYGSILVHRASDNGLLLLNSENGPVILGVNETEMMRISSTGNVGIGTTSPTQRLEVRDGGIALSSEEASVTLAFKPEDQSSTYVNTADERRMQLTTTGMNGSVFGYKFSWRNADGSARTDALSMHKDGLIGIGMNSPSYKLDVNGTVRATTYLYASDRRLKTDIKTTSGLDLVSRMHGVSFRWKDTGKAATGVIAQEIEKVLPNAVSTDKAGSKSVDYPQLIGPLIEAIKELKADNDNLRAELKAANDNHEVELDELRAEIEAIKGLTSEAR